MFSSRQLARLSRKKPCIFREKKELLAKWQSHFKVAVCRNHHRFINKKKSFQSCGTYLSSSIHRWEKSFQNVYRALFKRVWLNQNQSSYPSQSQQTQITQWTNQNSKQIHVTGPKRGKTRVSKSRLVWVLLLIGRESGARFFIQSQSEVKQNQSKTRITFDTQLKAALYNFYVFFNGEVTSKL